MVVPSTDPDVVNVLCNVRIRSLPVCKECLKATIICGYSFSERSWNLHAIIMISAYECCY